MELYKIGKIVSIGKTYIILESNYVGSILYVARPQDFKKNWIGKVYVYKYRDGYVHAFYGFTSFKERIMFENLLGVPGIGPKTALNLLSDGFTKLSVLIANGDAEGIAEYSAIGRKTADQIVFMLINKYNEYKDDGMLAPDEARSSLKTLGFNKKQIDYAVSKLEPGKNIEVLVEKAIVMIAGMSW